MKELLEKEYMNNTVLDYLIALGIIVIGMLAVRIIKNIVLTRLKKWAEATETKADDFVIQSTERFGIPALYYFVIYSGIHFLTLHPKAQNALNVATAVVITYLILRLLSTTILHLLQNYIRKQERGEEKVKQLGGLMILINVIIWLLGVLFLLDNLGQDVTALIAGLGIGGIAIALAAQNILGDLFNYFVIFFDRPFEVGDFIIVDDKLGTIEYIGLKTTRIRALSGEQLVIGNANLTASRIHNYKRLSRRRAMFSVDVEYGTPLEKVKQIPGLLAGIIAEQPLATFDRAHFARYTDWALRFDVVYFINAPEMNTYMDIQQQVNLRIYEEFYNRDIRFAFPSQSVYFNPNERMQHSLDKMGANQKN
jgi:small-conductance mechanosensitive channel